MNSRARSRRRIVRRLVAVEARLSVCAGDDLCLLVRDPGSTASCSITLFMVWLGKYSWLRAATGLGVSVSCSCCSVWFRCRCSRVSTTPASPATSGRPPFFPTRSFPWLRSARCSTGFRSCRPVQHAADADRDCARRHHRRASGTGGANGVAILLRSRSACRPPRRPSCCRASTGALSSAARSRRCCSTSPRALVGRDHLRRLSAGAAGPRGRGIDRLVHVVVHRRAVRGRHDHVPGAAGREVRAQVRAARVLLRLPAHVLPSSAWARARRGRRSSNAAGLRFAAVGMDNTGRLRLTFGFPTVAASISSRYRALGIGSRCRWRKVSFTGKSAKIDPGLCSIRGKASHTG